VEVQEVLEAALRLLADEFGKVFVPCVVGNHGRNSIKPRAKGRVFENYEWNLYCQLERTFRGDKRFLFQVPGETDAYFTVAGHRFLLTHGDCLGVKGGDGIIGALGPIARGAVKVGRSEAQIGRDFDTLLMGHWHTYIPRGDAAPVIVNGTLKGYDEYVCNTLNLPPSRAVQSLFFVHEKHGSTAQWPVYLQAPLPKGNQ
jgi:predicted phosphodiesterase